MTLPRTYLARLVRTDEITGRRVTLELIKDDDAVEIMPDDEFVSVTLIVDPFADPPAEDNITEVTTT